MSKYKHVKASTKYPGIYWRIFEDERPKQMWIKYDAPQIAGKRRTKWEEIPSKTVSAANDRRAKLRGVREREQTDATLFEVISAYSIAKLATKMVRTKQQYRYQLDCIEKQLGDIPVKDITPELCEGFLQWLTSKYSPNRVSALWMRFKDLLRWATVRDYLERNPMAKVELKPPTIIRLREPHEFTPEETSAFLSKVLELEPHMYALWLFWLQTGLRCGEMLGARWEFFNTRRGRYHVQEQMLPDGTLDAPKRGSVGDVAVDSDCVEAVEAFRRHEIHRRNLAKPPMTGLMWCQPNGKHWHRHGAQRALERMCKVAGLERRTLHDIRHTMACTLISQNASIVQVQSQLRHATPDITLRTYARAFDKDLVAPSFTVITGGKSKVA